MSKAKSKYILREYNELSVPTESQCIVRILSSRGNNLHEIVTPGGEQYLVSMPTKFRKSFWVKRDNYVLTEPIKEGDKVKGEIVKIITKDHIKWYRAHKCWPVEFDETSKENDHLTTNNSSDTNNEDIFVNTNRRLNTQEDSDSESESSESD